MRSLVKACENLNIPVSKIDNIGNFLQMKINNDFCYFTKVRVPINNESVAMICVNKAYAFWLLNEELPMPNTKAYFDPDAVEDDMRFQAEFKTAKKIAEDVLNNFELPVIIKMNSGSQGKHVYKCQTKGKIVKAVKAVFKKKQKDYDTSLLAQQFIQIKNEYRAILMDGEMLLLYEKVSKEKNRNLSPLHNDDGRAEIVTDENVISAIKSVVDNSPKLKNFEWIGLDIARDKNDEWFILELNTRPGFSYYIRDNGDNLIVKLYERLLTRIRDGKK